MRSWILTITLSLLFLAPAAQAQVEMTCAGDQVTKQDLDGLRALRALYNCQRQTEFDSCQSLLGQISGRPILAHQQRAAISMVSETSSVAADPETVEDSLEAVMLWDASTLLWPGTREIKLVSVANHHLPVIKWMGCSESQDRFINSAPGWFTCKPDIRRVDKRVSEFLSMDESEWRQKLKTGKVCEHYRARLDDLIKDDFKSLICGKEHIRSELQDGKVRDLYLNSQGKIERVVVTKGRYKTELKIDANNHPEAKVTDSMKVSDKEVVIQTRLDASHPFYMDIARLRLESVELATCCQSKDNIACRSSFGQPSARPEVANRR